MKHRPIKDYKWSQLFRAEALCQQQGKCCYCAEPLTIKNATADHVVPRKHGGVTRQHNIKAACRPCNQAKGQKSEKGFMALIRDPQPGDGLPIWLAWARRRIWMKTYRACERIARSVT